MLRRWVVFKEGEYLRQSFDWTTDNDVSKAWFFSTPEEAVGMANPVQGIVLIVDMNLHIQSPNANTKEKEEDNG